MIDSFVGEHSFLSNFYYAEMMYDGACYPTAENAYQAAKTTNHAERKPFRYYKPGDAKRAGRRLILRSNWDEIKISIMQDVLQAKFSNRILYQKLLNTGDQELIEGNYWNDRFWGVCRGRGENHLGQLLMKIRG